MPPSPPILRVEDVSLTFGGTPLIEGASFSVRAGDRVALVGRNGSGKSTLLKIVAGLVEPSAGLVTSERNRTIAYLPQSPDFGDCQTLANYVSRDLGPLDDPHRALALLDTLGMNPQSDPTNLSGGEARRAALAKTLASQADVLLLDEPTNHLDLPTIEWLEREVERLRSAVILISHDRRFLNNVSRKTLWIDRGTVRELGQGFEGFEAWRDTVLEEEERDLHKLKRKIVREEHWLTYGVTARRKRNQKRLAGLHSLRKAFREHQRPEGTAKLEASETAASGKLVIEAKSISKAYDSRPLVTDFSIRIHRGDRIGLVGPNGAGKTTLIRLLTKELEPESGSVRHGSHLEIATLDQKREALDEDQTLENFLTDGRGQSLIVNGEQKHVTSYMKDFLFKPEQARTPVRNLSGGERARLVLARLLARPANLLVLDEPTNDLDMETLDLLQELIGGFPGTVLLVSHDRDFLDRTVSAVVAPDGAGHGRWLVYAGGYSDMSAQRGAASAKYTKPKKQTTADKPKAQTTQPKSAKLSYKDKYALETLPGEIEQLAERIEALEKELSDPDLFTSDPDRFAELSKQLASASDEHAQKEERWLELEILRESLGA